MTPPQEVHRVRSTRAWLEALHPEHMVLGILAAVTATAPLALHPTTRLPGSELAGAFSHVWKFWWTHQAVAGSGVNPAFTPLLRFPEGLEVGRVMAGFGDAFWAMPITALLGPVAAFDAVVLASVAAGFWAAAVLAGRAGLERGPAVLVGLAWSLAPHHLGYLYGGAIEYMASPWTPLFLLALLELLGWRAADGSPPPTQGRLARLAAGLAACLFLQAMTSLFKGMVLAVFGGLVVSIAAVAFARRSRRGAAFALGGLLAGGLVVVAASAWLFPAPESAAATGIELVSAGLDRLRIPRSPLQPGTTAVGPPEIWMKNNHLLWTVAGLALLGACTRRGRLWLLLASPFLADLLLPQRVVAGWRLHVPEVLAPYLTSPAMVLGMADRRVFLVHLFLALSAGHGLAWLQARLAARRLPRVAAWLPAVALAVWVAEAVRLGPLDLPVPTFEARIQPHARFLAEAEPGAVIDLPLMVRSPWSDPFLCKAVRSRYLLQQTVHHRPILTWVGSRAEYVYGDLPQVDPLLEVLDRRSRPERGIPPRPTSWRPDALVAAGYRWVVLHPPGPSFGDAKGHERLSSDLRALMGTPKTFPDGVQVFRVPDPEGW